jgi:drug/metabolite transporter (DMT)-like permease
VPSRPALAFIVAVLASGLNYIGVRYSNDELAPFWGAAIRTGVAAVIMLALTVSLRVGLPRGSALAGAAIFGIITFGVSTALGYWGLVDAPAGLASVITSLAPLLSIALASAHGLERLGARRVLGAFIATAGIAIVFADQLGQNVPLLSQLALLVSIVCFCEAAVLLKVLPRAHPISVNAVGMSAGAVALVATSLLAGESMRLPSMPTTWFAVGYLVVGSMLLFGLYLFVLGRWDASAVSYLFVLSPIVTISTGILLRGEHVAPSFLAGAVLVVVGVYIGALSSRPRERPAPPREREAQVSAERA